jgi:regulatory protein
MSDDDPLHAATEQAMRWLARREYGRVELQRRLHRKGHCEAAVNATLDRLLELDLQSDERFTESYIRARSQRGYGPLRIRAELGERGVSRDLIAAMLDLNEHQWLQLATDALMKRYPDAPPDSAERSRRERFLRYRGFVQQQVAHAMAAYQHQ